MKRETCSRAIKCSLRFALAYSLILIPMQSLFAVVPDPITAPFESDWRDYNFSYYHGSVGQVLMWKNTGLNQPAEQAKTRAETARILAQGKLPLFQMAWDGVTSTDPGQKEWCEWKQSRSRYWILDRFGKKPDDDYYTDAITAVMPYDSPDWPAGVINGTRNDWDLDKMLEFAKATGAVGYFAADKYDLGWAHYMRTAEYDFNPRIIDAFGARFNIVIPGGTVRERSDFIRNNCFNEWTDFICEGTAVRHTMLQPRLKAMGVNHPMVAFQVDYPVVTHRLKGLDYRMVAERAGWGEVLKRVELQGDGLRDLKPNCQACNDFGLFASLAPDMMFGAQMNADHEEFWNSVNRVFFNAGLRTEFGRKYLRQHWLSVGWWHIANLDGTVRRGVCEFMRHYWDGGTAPAEAVNLVRSHVPVRPFGFAFYYSRPVELIYEKKYPSTGRLYPMNDKAYAAQWSGLPVGYSVSDVALGGLTAHRASHPAAWLTTDVDKIPAGELAGLKAIAPVYDMNTADFDAIPSLIRFSPGACGYAFHDQNDKSVFLIWRQGRPPGTNDETRYGDRGMKCQLDFHGIKDGIYWVKDLFNPGTEWVIEISGGSGGFSFDLDRWDCRAFISNLMAPNVFALPGEFALAQNYPNPFNRETLIQFDVRERSRVTLKVYNVLGNPIATLKEDILERDRYSVRWDGKNGFGDPVPSGVYFSRLEAASLNNNTIKYGQTIKMVLLK